MNPASFTIASGQTKTLTITIDGEGLAADQQYFGSITLDAAKANANDVFLPVAFFKQQGGVRLTHSCSPTTFPRVRARRAPSWRRTSDRMTPPPR